MSIGNACIGFGNGVGDDDACIKSTHGKSWSRLDKGNYHKTTIHLSSGSPELVANEDPDVCSAAWSLECETD